MANILVSGLINIETNLKVDSFPLYYSPVLFPFYGVSNNPSGVGLNLSVALQQLGNQVTLTSLLANDFSGRTIRNSLEQSTIDTSYILDLLTETPLTVVIADQTGKRQIHCDLKDIQDIPYPLEVMQPLITACDLVILTPLQINRPFLSLAKRMGNIIATDLHVLTDLYDPYQVDFLKHADIVFFSNEGVIGREHDFMRTLNNTYHPKIIVCGMGSQGSLLLTHIDATIHHIPAVYTRPVVNTIGAGDALFASFIHYFQKGDSPLRALQKATYYASYKIGENGAALGLLSQDLFHQLLLDKAPELME